jgi:hypothetical protein
MADISITTYTNKTYKNGASTTVPGFVEGSPGSPVNPPGSGGASEFVPYVGALQNVNLGEKGISVGFVTLDTTPTNTPNIPGTFEWDASKETIALIMNGTTQRIGQDLYIYVKNSTGADIAKGLNVGFAGTDGASGHILIKKFLANGSEPSYYYIGVTAELIANGSFGQVMIMGELSGVNTLGYSPNALLYASTTVAGAFQTTAPVAPNNIILVAAAINFKNNGEIRIRPTIGSNINQDEGVKITSPATGDLLERQSNGLFENRTKAAMGLITGSLTANYLPKATGTTILGNSQIIDNGTNILVNKTVDSGQKFQVDGTVLLNNTLTEIAGLNPTLRLKTSGNVFIINFRKDSNEDAATVKFDDAVDEFAITTNVTNYPIRIQPHGTGTIKIPNVPTGTGDVLMRDTNNNLVRSTGTFVEQTTGTFTPTLVDDGGGATYSYTVNRASYVKVGRIVTIYIHLRSITSSGTPSGFLRISSLPFEIGLGSTFGISVITFANSSYSSADVDVLRGVAREDSNMIQIYKQSNASLVAPTFTSNGIIQISGTYFTT